MRGQQLSRAERYRATHPAPNARDLDAWLKARPGDVVRVVVDGKTVPGIRIYLPNSVIQEHDPQITRGYIRLQKGVYLDSERVKLQYETGAAFGGPYAEFDVEEMFIPGGQLTGTIVLSLVE